MLQGEASGIKLASLLKLSAVKTMDRKRTLLHIFADFCDKVRHHFDIANDDMLILVH
jgi:hypothetical protein